MSKEPRNDMGKKPWRGQASQNPKLSGTGADAHGPPRQRPSDGGKRADPTRGAPRPEHNPGRHKPHRHERKDRARERARDAEDGPLRLFGIHPVEAALRNPARRVTRLFATENAARRLTEALGTVRVPVEETTPRDLDRILGAEAVHQGVMIETEPLPEPDLQSLAENAAGRPLLVLDQVTDPHNVGAILRSAAVFGAGGLIMTRRHSPPLNGVLAKSASGALELVPIALVGNLASALAELKDVGFTLIGLDGTAEARLEETDWSRPTALVMGAEGKGLRELTQKLCDVLAHITTDGPIASLNVSNAAAIALHTAALARIKT